MGLTQFVVENKKYFSLAGLAIVLLTYIVKDNLLEAYKADVASVEAAEKEFLVHRDVLSTKKAVALLERKLPDSNNIPAKRSRMNETRRQRDISEQIALVDGYVDQLNNDRRALEMVQEDYEAAMAIGQTISGNEYVHSLITNASDAIKNENNSIGAVDAEIQIFDDRSVDDPKYNEFKTHLINSYLSLGIPFTQAVEATNAMSEGVVAQGKKTVEERLRRVRMVTFICQVLFVVGWILSLSDKIELGPTGSKIKTV